MCHHNIPGRNSSPKLNVTSEPDYTYTDDLKPTCQPMRLIFHIISRRMPIVVLRKDQKFAIMNLFNFRSSPLRWPNGLRRHCVGLACQRLGAQGIMKAIFRLNVPSFTWKIVLRKTTLSTPDRDSNLDLPVIGSLVYCESSAIDHETTEAYGTNKAPSSHARQIMPVLRLSNGIRQYHILLHLLDNPKQALCHALVLLVRPPGTLPRWVSQHSLYRIVPRSVGVSLNTSAGPGDPTGSVPSRRLRLAALQRDHNHTTPAAVTPPSRRTLKRVRAYVTHIATKCLSTKRRYTGTILQFLKDNNLWVGQGGCLRENGKPYRKNHPSDRDSNLDLPVIGSLVYCKSSALDHGVTEAELSAQNQACYPGKVKTTCADMTRWWSHGLWHLFRIVRIHGDEVEVRI
uniref:Uncharacterized protein n=1 Tax=Timema cristinae TaxID=61476 RepID=A0A7R9CMY3_TIMCR|nr:unnamed protein product [Timema cristinae]